MNVTVPIPDDLAARFGSEAELTKRVIEALVLEEYRGGRLALPELHQILGFANQSDMTDFLKDHGLLEDVACEGSAGQVQASRLDDETAGLVARFQAFAASHTLAGLEIKDLIAEGRR